MEDASLDDLMAALQDVQEVKATVSIDINACHLLSSIFVFNSQAHNGSRLYALDMQ